MKQTYIKPQTRQVYLQLNQMIALSLGEKKAGSGTTVLSREDRFWDDDDED